MDVLKVKVNGQWVGIPSIQGEKGDQGDPGVAGQDGQDGASAYVHIKYSATEPSSDSDMKSTADAWMGICSSNSSTPSTHYTDYTWYKIKGETGAAGVVQDVQVNGSSILNNGVANIPYASGSDTGVVKVNGDFGTSMRSSPNDNTIMLQRAAADDIQTGAQRYKPITPSMIDVATFFGLAKAAGVDLKNETVTLGQYPASALVAIQKMLGVYESPWELINEVTLTQDETEIVINVDSYGESFELTDLIAMFDAPVSTTGNRDSFYGLVFFKNLANGNTNSDSIPSLRYLTNTSKMLSRIEIGNNGGTAPFYARVTTATGDGNTQVAEAMTKKSLIGEIRGIKIYQSSASSSLVPAGANLKLYGKRIVE